MAKYEYKIKFQGEETASSFKKELVIEQLSENYIRIFTQGDNAAIIAFLPDGKVRLYKGNTERAGLTPELF